MVLLQAIFSWEETLSQNLQQLEPVIEFQDITAAAGLNQFQHRSGSREKRFILEAPSGGLALFDFDGDNRTDIFLLNGSTFPALAGEETPPSAALFRNRGNGTFQEVTVSAGVANERWGFGAAVGDYNSDGWPDLFVANFGKDRLYRNNCDGTFTDVAESAGVAGDAWTTAPAFGDFDGDGLLDLFVAGYVDFDPADLPPAPGQETPRGSFCEYLGKPVFCGPRGLPGERDYLYRNNGDGTFTEVAEKAGVADSEKLYGLAASWVDLNEDGLLDLVVANDATPNLLYRNRGDGTFEDLSLESGFAYNLYGRAQAGMGIASGDYDNDGDVDLYLTHFSFDYNTLYQNQGDFLFRDVTFEANLGTASMPLLGWGTGFVDFDNDADLDLFVANGHIYPEVDQFPSGTSMKQVPLVFRNQNGRRFQMLDPPAESPLSQPVIARGAAFGDLDGDGKVDVVLNCSDGSPRLFRNVTKASGHWLGVRLKSGGVGPGPAIGATVLVKAGTLRQRRDLLSGGSFASQSQLLLHFGLAESKQVESIEVHWPGGSRQIIRNPAIDTIVEIRRPLPSSD